MSDFEALLCAHGNDVGLMLDELLSDQLRAPEVARPARLLAAMRHATLNGGKRLRPFLAIETGRLLGLAPADTLRAACAVELIHCYSLVHDDLPAMDDDDLRRGQPTVHKAFDEATAILAGDSLLTYAFDVAAAPDTHVDAQVRAELVLALARASGLGGMAGGQALDLEAERAQAPLTIQAIRQLQFMKTGALIAVSVEIGAILARADAPQRAALATYGRALGAAFQIADDILDASGDEAAVGKRIGKDAGRNKATLVEALGVAEAQFVCSQLVAEAQSALAIFDARADTLRQTALFVANRSR